MSKRYKKDEPINMGKFLVAHGAKRRKATGPFIVRDYYNGPLAYESPLTGKRIDSRIERHKEMKAHNVREVDPSETPYHRKEDRSYINDPKMALKHGLDIAKWEK